MVSLRIASRREAQQLEQNAGGLVHLFQIDGTGRAEALDTEDIAGSLEAPLPSGGWRWLHVNRSDETSRRWLERESGLSTEVLEAMLSDDTQPRAAELDGGLLLILRGRNRDVGQRIADLVSIRLFMTSTRVISVRLRPFAPSARLAEIYKSGPGPTSPSAFLDRMLDIMLAQIEEGLDWIGAEIDELEEIALTGPGGELQQQRGTLNSLKRAVIARRRYLRPQQHALARLATLDAGCLEQKHRSSFAEAADQTGRIVEDLDELRERATIVAEEMQARMTDRLNRTLVTLAIVSTVFLPLTVVTSLFGVNLEGIPYHKQEWSFSAFVAMLGFVALLSVLLVRNITQR